MSVIAVLTSYVSLSRGQYIKAFVRIRFICALYTTSGWPVICALCTTSGRSTLFIQIIPMLMTVLLIHTCDIEIVVQNKHSFNVHCGVCYFNYRNSKSFVQIFFHERYQKSTNVHIYPCFS